MTRERSVHDPHDLADAIFAVEQFRSDGAPEDSHLVAGRLLAGREHPAFGQRPFADGEMVGCGSVHRG